MKKFDNFLTFNLPSGYILDWETDDDGVRNCFVKAEKSINDEGETEYKYSVNISEFENGDENLFNKNEAEVFSVKGNLKNLFAASKEEMSLLFLTMEVYTLVSKIEKDGRGYVIMGRRAVGSGDNDELRSWVDFFCKTLSSASVGNTAFAPEKDLKEKIISAFNSYESKEEENSEFPVAKPLDGQHSQLDFQNNTKSGLSFLGGMVSINQNGTEFSFQPLTEDCVDEESPLWPIIAKTNKFPVKEFDLTDTALAMSELFRVSPDAFDPGHDREQEIRGGLIQRALTYNELRSFAWTLAAYCDREKTTPAALDYATIESMVEFIGDRNGLNYKGESFSPAICSGDDIHFYCIPDSGIALLRSAIKKIGDESGVASLEGFRRELDYMYPAIRAIYDELAETRDRDEPLEGGCADILYAWCAAAYAAREPFYTEDGPMNCYWGESDGEWELRWRTERLENEISNGKQWLKDNMRHIEKKPYINFSGKSFVFSGVESLDEWLDILNILIKKGGLHRSSVSGKTDYLVCNPYQGGESKLKHALEQRAKGKNIKIILLEDFLKAINMKIRTPEEELAELKSGKEKEQEIKSVAGRLKPVERPSGSVRKKEEKEIREFTYNDNLRAGGKDYTIDIPDGFAIKKNIENRDFIAYLPNKSDPDDYLSSDFVIYAGVKQELDFNVEFRTIAEYGFLAEMAGKRGVLMFEQNKYDVYPRRDLPGGFISAYSMNTVHIYGYFGVGNHLQMIRLQIDNVRKSDMDSCRRLAAKIFDRMQAREKVKLLEPADAEEYIGMSPSGVKKWTNLIDEYITHYSAARNIFQNFIVNEYQSSDDYELRQFKKDLKEMLGTVSRYAETTLKEAETVYELKRALCFDEKSLEKMKKSLLSLADFANQYVNLDEEQLRVDSAFAKEMRKRLLLSADKAIEALLSEKDMNISEKTRALLEKAGKEYKEVARKAEEEKKRLAEEKRKKEEEERKRREEEEKRIYEEKLKKHQEWEKAYAEASGKRSAWKEKEVNSKREELERQAKELFEKNSDITKKNIGTCENELARLRDELQHLGFFAFGEKSRIKKQIEALENKISAEKLSLEDIKKNYDNTVKMIPANVKSYENSLNLDKSGTVLPPEPENPLKQKKDSGLKNQREKEQSGDRNSSNSYSLGKTRKLENEKLGNKILEILLDRGEAMTISEISEASGIESNQKIQLAMNNLVDKGMVRKFVESRRVFYEAE